MNAIENLEWFAVHTKPMCEEVARWNIASLGLETLMPRTRVRRTAAGITRVEVRPLFQGYLFARFVSAKYLHLVRFCRGVCRVVGTGSRPSAIEESIIQDLRERMNSEGLIPLQPRGWKRGDAVEISEGPLRGWSGVFEEELKDEQRVIILLNSIQQARVVLERTCLGAV